jgi:hypothetical protein
MQSDDLVARARDEIAAVRGAGNVETVQHQCMILVRPGYINHGHWLTEMLSQLLSRKPTSRAWLLLSIPPPGVSAPMQGLTRDSIVEFA